MANLRLCNKKKAQNSHAYNFDDLPSYNDWIVENEEDWKDVNNLDVNAHDEENLIKVEMRESIDGHNLDIPSFANELVIRVRETYIEDMKVDVCLILIN